MSTKTTQAWKGMHLYSLLESEGIFISTGKHSPNLSPNCTLELLVLHAVDEGVQSWGHHGVQNCQQKVEEWRRDGGGLQVGKCASADEQRDHSQVREACGKGFVPALLRGHPQHSPEDWHIGQHKENKTPRC